MENQTKPKLLSSDNSKPETSRAERLGWIIDQLSLIAIARGQDVLPERLRLNAEDLIDISQEALSLAFRKARQELNYYPTVAEIRAFAGSSEEGTVDAEARAAWEMLELFVRRYVDCDVYGNYGPEYGWYPQTYPLLSERIIGTVRRTGGWVAYKTMTNEQFPFQQRRFFDEYKAFSAVERVTDHGRLLVMQPRQELAAAPVEPKTVEVKPIPHTPIKTVPPELTAAQLRDRREMIRQQSEAMKARYSTEK